MDYSPWGCQRVRHDRVTEHACVPSAPSLHRVAQRMRCMPRAIRLLSGTSRIQAKLPISTPTCASCTNSHHAYLDSMVLHQPTWASMHSDPRLALAAPFVNMRVPHSCVIYPSMGAEGTHFELSPRIEQTETDSPSGCRKFCTNYPGHCTAIHPVAEGTSLEMSFGVIFGEPFPPAQSNQTANSVDGCLSITDICQLLTVNTPASAV